MNISEADRERIRTELDIIVAANQALSAARWLERAGGYKDIKDSLNDAFHQQVQDTNERIKALATGTATRAAEPERERIKTQWQSIAAAVGLLEFVVSNDDLPALEEDLYEDLKQDLPEDWKKALRETLREDLRGIFQEDVRRQVREGLTEIEALKRPLS